MVGKLFISLTILLALIELLNALPPSENEYMINNKNSPYNTNDNPATTDNYPLYWQYKNPRYLKNDNVVIVEPTITYTSHAEAEYQPILPNNFKPSPIDKTSDFIPYTGRTDNSGSYYPYYIRASSYDRNVQSANEVNRSNDQNRGLDPSDPAYQRFVPRNYQNRDTIVHNEDQNNRQRQYYYQTTYTTDNRPSPPEPQISSKSSVRFYYPNGTEVHTYYNSDNQQVMDLYPNQYVLQLSETTTTTTTTSPPVTNRPVNSRPVNSRPVNGRPVNSRPVDSRPANTEPPIYWRDDIDCPPFYPCNTVVYQPTTQCCKCYLVANRCCSCNYNINTNRNTVYNK